MIVATWMLMMPVVVEFGPMQRSLAGELHRLAKLDKLKDRLETYIKTHLRRWSLAQRICVLSFRN